MRRSRGGTDLQPRDEEAVRPVHGSNLAIDDGRVKPGASHPGSNPWVPVAEGIGEGRRALANDRLDRELRLDNLPFEYRAGEPGEVDMVDCVIPDLHARGSKARDLVPCQIAGLAQAPGDHVVGSDEAEGDERRKRVGESVLVP